MNIKSKIVVLDSDQKSLDIIKSFLQQNDLIGMRAQKFEVVKTLNEHVDLGALILSDVVDETGVSGFDIAIRAHNIRRELPIFMRLSQGSADDVPEKYRPIISGYFQGTDMAALKALIDKFLFCIYYPDELVSGITRITEEVLVSNFKNCNVIVDHPIVVRDQFIYGELFSLIALECDWGRGYMMMQADEEAIFRIIECGSTGISTKNITFREVNGVLSEITNMVWGKLKARYMSSYVNKSDITKPQVPIMINHNRNFASFGTVNPQLCFHYEVREATHQIEAINFIQKFVFNLDWSPENFKSDESIVDNCVESGELELW